MILDLDFYMILRYHPIYTYIYISIFFYMLHKSHRSWKSQWFHNSTVICLCFLSERTWQELLYLKIWFGAVRWTLALPSQRQRRMPQDVSQYIVKKGSRTGIVEYDMHWLQFLCPTMYVYCIATFDIIRFEQRGFLWCVSGPQPRQDLKITTGNGSGCKAHGSGQDFGTLFSLEVT